MSRWKKKFRPTQCPFCADYRPAKDERDPGMSEAPWTKNRCVSGWKWWWQFDQEKELVGVTNAVCKKFLATNEEDR